MHTTAIAIFVLYAASDASFANNHDGTSTAGYAFRLYDGPIDWKSFKQQSVTLSSTEAELHGVNHAARELRWWQRLFAFLGLPFHHAPNLHCDNRQVVQIVNNERSPITSKMRHIELAQLWARQEVLAGRLRIKWVPSHLLYADGFTKNLMIGKFRNFFRQINMMDTRTMAMS